MWCTVHVQMNPSSRKIRVCSVIAIDYICSLIICVDGGAVPVEPWLKDFNWGEDPATRAAKDQQFEDALCDAPSGVEVKLLLHM